MGRKGKRSDLGRAIARRKERDREESRNLATTPAAQRAAALGRHTLNYDDRTKLQSVLDATDVEELMLNATLANADFASERYPGPVAPQTVVVTPLAREPGGWNTAEKEKRRQLDSTVLRIPRRPAWDENTTAQQLLETETDQFLRWRRAIASVEQEHEMSATIGGPMMTPFEKNLEVWRQLWRVVERSDVVVQIVDARNPLLYYCDDLYRYVTVEMRRSHLLLLNKADLLSNEMISKWDAYFRTRGLQVKFFSAFKASVNETADDHRVIGAQELIDILHGFERCSPQTQENQRLVVGMCGYPNVGKSSTINVLLETAARSQARTSDESKSLDPAPGHDSTGEPSNPENDYESHTESGTGSTTHSASTHHIKRVAVSSTPGKTKHFQTLALTPSVLLCDCPGLVFPNFSSSKSELIISGVLSIDTMRGDHITPVSLIASRIPAHVFALVYGIRFPDMLATDVTTELDPSLNAKKGHVSGAMLLEIHARARGFMTDHGRADTSRSARVLLKDFVNGRVIFAHAPPPGDIEGGESGVGPGVHAKKGKLLHKRVERGEAEKRKGVESVGGIGVTIAPDLVGAVGGGEVRAMVSGKKKDGHRVFTRVERSYYPVVE